MTGRTIGGSTIVLGVGLVLILIGMASVVATLPNDPQPTPVAGPLPITFGHTLDEDTYLVTDPTTQFRLGDPFAYSVNPPVHPGVENVYVAIARFEGGAEVELQAPTPQRLLPEPVSFGYATTTNDMVELFGYGQFTMKIYLDPVGAVYARGRFEIVDPGIPE
ncbi:MAG TPA: hypothetical protein VIC63_07465 [Candidatus Limnocylindria bacterium]